MTKQNTGCVCVCGGGGGGGEGGGGLGAGVILEGNYRQGTNATCPTCKANGLTFSFFNFFRQQYCNRRHAVHRIRSRKKHG